MFAVGPHVSIAGGLSQAPARARALGASGFAMFVKNQRQWQAPPLSPEEAADFKAACRECGYKPEHILPHAGYLLNPANPDAAKRERTILAMTEEFRRCAACGLTLMNFHPGSSLGSDRENALRNAADTVRQVLETVPGVTAVFENTAGQGNTLGGTLEELSRLLEYTAMPERTGICIDSCHAAASGYDFSREDEYLRFFRRFDELIGLRFLKGLHLNDAMGEAGSHLDRHAPLGDGKIGWNYFKFVVSDRRFEGIPLILETPDEEKWPFEVAELMYTGK